MTKIAIWVESTRPKTLLLAFASPLMGTFLAWSEGEFRWYVFLLAASTTFFLQILSNFANDYGDFISNADNNERIGPQRPMQRKEISPRQMRRGILIASFLSLVSGLLLIWQGTEGKNSAIILIYILLGILAILAAIKYTVGKNPYGYRGLGDLAVFLFFGLLGVLGTYYLHTGSFNPWHALPASAIGLLCSGVLNLNNMRDYESDKKANKKTLVVCLGNRRSKYYHLFLIMGSAILGPLYVLFNYQSAYQLLFLITFPLFLRNLIAVFNYTDPQELYPELKRLVAATIIFVVAFGVGHIL